MSDKEIYDEIYRKIMNVQTNLMNATNSLDSFYRRTNSSLVVNDIALYKESIRKIKDDINTKYLKIKNEVIPEVQSKLI